MDKGFYSNREESDFLAGEKKEENSEKFGEEMVNVMFALMAGECLVPVLHFWCV